MTAHVNHRRRSGSLTPDSVLLKSSVVPSSSVFSVSSVVQCLSLLLLLLPVAVAVEGATAVVLCEVRDKTCTFVAALQLPSANRDRLGDRTAMVLERYLPYTAA
jgi:hypothetical protein